MANELQNVLYERYNYDDVFNRVIIVGLLNLLNHGISYTQTWDNSTVESVNVPFMYDFGSSDERFAQDNYTSFGRECFSDKKIDGKFDILPRGTVKYTGSQIDASNITNRFVQGRYLKNENGKLTSYTSFLYSIPITFNFDIEMWIDNIITAFKIEQAIRETFYKNRTYYVLYQGMKLNCCVGFPESATLDKTTNYSFDAERQIKITFTLAVEAYQPVFDRTTAVESGNRMESIAYDVEVLNSSADRISSIKIKDFEGGVIYPSGTSMLIEWDTSSTVSDMCTVAISYIDSAGVEHSIEHAVYNNHSYLWRIPEGFTDYKQPLIVYNDPSKVISEPVIKLIPDKNKFITEESFVIVDPGVFNTAHDEQLGITLEYTDSTGHTQLSDAYSVNISNRQININDPVTITGDAFRYSGTINSKEISIKVTYPLNPSVYDETDKLLIL